MANEATEARLEEQIGWYDQKSRTSKNWFVSLRIVGIVAAASVSVLVMAGVPDLLVAIVGAVIVVMEGVQQLLQFQANWTSYRSTCEELKHEKYLFAVLAGPYSTAQDPGKLLAERIESFVSKEHAKWISSQEIAVRNKQS